MGASTTAVVPPGFTLDSPVAQAGLPPGFTLDPPSRTLPANAGLANFGASVAGIPVDAVQNVMNLGRAAIGTGATALGRPDLAPDLQTGAVGGSDWLKAKLRQTGQPGLSPDNPNPQDKLGTAQYDFVSRGGVVPGAALPAAASMVAEKIGGPQWAGVGALAPSAATAAFNAARAPGLAQQQAQNVTRDATLKKAQDAGYVMPPSAVNPTVAGNTVESFAGKAALKQEAALKNQQVTNRLTREELGLPENTPLTTQALETLRKDAAQPYRDVAAISPMAEKVLQRLRDARAEANLNYRHYDVSATPESLRTARRMDSQADMLERVLEHQATKAGKPELVQQLRDARTKIAKTWDVERALNLGDGNIDAQIIGRALDRGRPLTGNLETIAKFAQGPGRQFTSEAAKVSAPGVSALNWPAAAVLGVEGSHYLGHSGAALAAIPFARGGVRSGLLSDLYQRNFNRPDYTPNVQPQGALESLLQQSILAAPR